MSHFDAVTVVPAGFVATASTPDAPVAAMEHPDRKIWGVQWHPEVVHTPHGMAVLQRFLHDLAGCEPNWTMGVDHRRAGRRSACPGGHRAGDLRAQRRCRLGRRRGAGAQGHRPPAGVHLRRHRPDAAERERPGGRDVQAQHGHRADPRQRRPPLLREAGRRGRAGGEAQDHRRAVRAHLRGAHRWAQRRRVPRAGHAVPRCHRERRQRRHRLRSSRAITTSVACPTT